MNSAQQYIDLYEQEKDTFYQHSAAVLNAQRGAACEALRQVGLPGRKDERFRYIDIQALFAPNYGINLHPQPAKVTLTAAQRGFFIGSFKDFEQAYPSLLQNHYNRLAQDKDAVVALNTMLAQDGVVVYVERGVRLEQPIQVVNTLCTGQTPSSSVEEMMINRRVIIILEECSELKILFCDHAESNKNLLATTVTEVFIGENATLDLTNIEVTQPQNRLLNSTFIEQKAHSSLTHSTVTLRNGTSRNSLDIDLCGEGAACQCNGCVILDQHEQADNNIHISHTAAHCDSNVLYKYVLNDASKGSFAGKILVCKGSQQTNASMRNNNLCSTREARMQTQPMLEIYADDIKCSHGATTGQINDAAMFYMQSRGISKEQAKQLLQLAFIREVLDNMPHSATQEHLLCLVERRLSEGQSMCTDCSGCV